ncbi:MAG: HxlR-like helix-turn-helix [Thermoplasmata archaeon]|nr:HxlR-like helix-turn-helix [Thermoplasmata archaeon]
MTDAVAELLAQRHALRILHFLHGKAPRRFSEIQKGLRLNPAQVDRALKGLVRGGWLVPTTDVASPQAKRVVVRYGLTKRGEAIVKALHGFRVEAEKQKKALGEEMVEEIRALLA